MLWEARVEQLAAERKEAETAAAEEERRVMAARDAADEAADLAQPGGANPAIRVGNKESGDVYTIKYDFSRGTQPRYMRGAQENRYGPMLPPPYESYGTCLKDAALCHDINDLICTIVVWMKYSLCAI